MQTYTYALIQPCVCGVPSRVYEATCIHSQEGVAHTLLTYMYKVHLYMFMYVYILKCYQAKPEPPHPQLRIEDIFKILPLPSVLHCLNC